MRLFSSAWAMMILLLGASAAAVRAADAKPDLSSPKKAATAFAVALQKGDFATVQSVTTGTPEDYKLIQSVTNTTAASFKLKEAAIARFGPDDAKKMETGGSDPAAIARQIEESTEKLEGDSASITMNGVTEANAVQLKKINGEWKVDLAHYPQKQAIAQQLPMLAATGKILAQAAGDIAAGKYKSATDASLDIQQRMIAVMASIARPAQPAATQGRK